MLLFVSILTSCLSWQPAKLCNFQKFYVVGRGLLQEHLSDCHVNSSFIEAITKTSVKFEIHRLNSFRGDDFWLFFLF